MLALKCAKYYVKAHFWLTRGADSFPSPASLNSVSLQDVRTNAASAVLFCHSSDLATQCLLAWPRGQPRLETCEVGIAEKDDCSRWRPVESVWGPFGLGRQTQRSWAEIKSLVVGWCTDSAPDWPLLFANWLPACLCESA